MPDTFSDNMTREYVWVVRKNADTTEGRGPMVVDTIWAGNAEIDCKKYIERQPGVMGVMHDGSWQMEKVYLIKSGDDKCVIDELKIREIALRKLTDKEKKVLGLGDF